MSSKSLETEMIERGDEAIDDVIAAVHNDRVELAQLRTNYIERLNNHSDDYSATKCLSVINKALSKIGWDDTLDWRKRWARHRKP